MINAYPLLAILYMTSPHVAVLAFVVSFHHSLSKHHIDIFVFGFS